MPIQSSEEKEFCKVAFHYVADPETVLSKREEVIDRVFKETKKLTLPGYMKGRAPLNVVKLRYKKQIEETTRNELQSVAYDDIVFETKIKPIFYPQVSNINLNEANFECDMLFLKKPEFELKQYKELEIPKPHLGMTVGELCEQMLQGIREENGDVVPYGETDFIQLGDMVTFSVKGPPPLATEGTSYTVGSGYCKDFDDNILGMSVGEERIFDVNLEDNVSRVTLTVNLFMGAKKIPCALDDELAKKLNIESFEELRKRVEGIASNRMKLAEEQMIGQQIVSRLLESHDFKLPPWLVSMEAQGLAVRHRMKWEDLEDDTRSKILELAQKQVKLSMVMDSIREAEPETQFSDSELLELIRRKAMEMGKDPNQFLVETQKSGKLFGMVAALQHEATLQWLIGQAKIVE